MKRYIFEKINCSTSCGGAKISFNEHRAKINEYARRGFCYIGWIPTFMDGYGHIKEIDLIFATQKEEP